MIERERILPIQGSCWPLLEKERPGRIEADTGIAGSCQRLVVAGIGEQRPCCCPVPLIVEGLFRRPDRDVRQPSSGGRDEPGGASDNSDVRATTVGINPREVGKYDRRGGRRAGRASGSAPICRPGRSSWPYTGWTSLAPLALCSSRRPTSSKRRRRWRRASRPPKGTAKRCCSR